MFDVLVVIGGLLLLCCYVIISSGDRSWAELNNMALVRNFSRLGRCLANQKELQLKVVNLFAVSANGN